MCLPSSPSAPAERVLDDGATMVLPVLAWVGLVTLWLQACFAVAAFSSRGARARRWCWQKKRKEKEPKTLSAELARLTPDTWQQSVGRSVATATAMAVQRASYAVCEGVFVRPARPSRSV